MRNLFLLLLMANLVFAMWWLWVEPTDRPAIPAPAADASAPLSRSAVKFSAELGLPRW